MPIQWKFKGNWTVIHVLEWWVFKVIKNKITTPSQEGQHRTIKKSSQRGKYKFLILFMLYRYSHSGTDGLKLFKLTLCSIVMVITDNDRK